MDEWENHRLQHQSFLRLELKSCIRIETLAKIWLYILTLMFA